MRCSLYVLFNDRSFIQITGNVVGGCTDQLHAALIRLVIGLCSFESWEEGVMDIDASSNKLSG